MTSDFAIATDPVKNKQYALEVVQVRGRGGGSLFIKTHPKSNQPVCRYRLNPDPAVSQSVAVFDTKNLEKGFKVLPIAQWAGPQG